MAFRDTIRTLLDTVTLKNFSDVAPQAEVPPYITYRITGVTPDNTKNGVSKSDHPSFIVDCFAPRLADAITMAASVRTALDYYSDSEITSIVFEDQSDDFSFESNLSQIRQTYSMRIKRS